MRQPLKAINLLGSVLAVVAIFVSSAERVYGQNENLPTDSLRRVSFVFTGDLMQHLPQVVAARQSSGEYDWSDCFAYVATIFDRADVVVTNLETTLTYDGRYSGYPQFSSPHSLARSMQKAGIDIAVNANNHICDRGYKGIEQTIVALDSAEIRHTGAFVDRTRSKCENPLIFSCNGLKFALLNATYSTNGISTPKGAIVNRLDTIELAEQVERAQKENVDLIIAMPHWGNEYQRTPSHEQRKLAEWYYRHGIRLIVGSHPHVIQPISRQCDSLGQTERLTAWSLGNFVSNQNQQHTDGGLILVVTVSKHGNQQPKIDYSYQYGWRYRRSTAKGTRYAVVPSSMADSILANDTEAHKQFLRFVNAQELLIKGNN